MATTPSSFQTPLPGPSGPLAVVTAGPLQTVTLMKVIATNTDSVPHTVAVYLVNSGDTPVITNNIMQPYSISAGDTVPLPLSGLVLTAGQSLQMNADIISVVNVSGGMLIQP